MKAVAGNFLKKGYEMAKKKARHDSMQTGHKLQVWLGEGDNQKMHDLIARMGASSEFEATRRMIRFFHRITALTDEDIIFIYVAGEKIMVPF